MLERVRNVDAWTIGRKGLWVLVLGCLGRTSKVASKFSNQPHKNKRSCNGNNTKVCVCACQAKKKKHNAKKKNGRKVRWFEFVAGQPFSEGNFDLCPKVILITFQKWKELVQLKTQQIEEIGLKAGVVKNKKKKRKPQTNQREEEQRKERKEQEEATRDGRETKGEIGRICWAACRRQS